MTKLFFLPIGIIAGILGGLLSKKAFALAWSAIDDREPPTPETRHAATGKLALALSLEGAAFRLTRGLVDHGSRRAFAALTGAWPGEDAGRDA
ncbi:MAG: hypothetical protein JWN10_2375 [Solirubrobacterales bacterium]|nr:hypothetical protein [Solirubrobacterales bacterium]